MRAYRFFCISSLSFLALLIFFSLIALLRYSLPYNIYGVYIDELGKTTYHQQSADIFAILAVIFAFLFILNGLFYKKYKI